MQDESWQTKPSDRFILRWIKCNLSARVTPRLLRFQWLSPWMITLCSTFTGMLAGLFFALGFGFAAGLTAMISQVLDGVDGQFARFTGGESAAGALLDSVMDRYADGALMMGMCIYIIRLPWDAGQGGLLILAFFALIGSGTVSYSSARADSLSLNVEQSPTLASKGTRTTVMALCGLVSPVWPAAPIAALWYLAIHPNVVVAKRVATAFRNT